MLKKYLLAAVAACALAGPAFAGCDTEFDALAKAVSGPVTMAEGHRAAMMRLALSSYDHCMAGDSKASGNIREMLMEQLRASLGGR